MSDQQASDYRRLEPKVLKKFYEPVVLLQALNLATRDNNTASQAPNSERVDRKDEKQVFQTFVYKLAYVCDSTKGAHGETVSAFAVLRDPNEKNGVEYLFTSNQRTTQQMEVVRQYMMSLLEIVAQTPDLDDRGESQEEVLRRVVNFNKKRIANYMSAVDSQINECLRYCDSHGDEQDEVLDSTIKSSLSGMKDRLDFKSQRDWSSDTFISQYDALSQKLWKLLESPAGQLIKTRALAGRLSDMRSVGCWSEFRHAANRIVAYKNSVEYFFQARRKWPELFSNFRVSFRPSSTAYPNPSRVKSFSAEGIVNRMTRKENLMKMYKGFVERLQVFDLDTRVENEYRRQGFRPIVHSEVLLLDWLHNNRGLSSETFFNGWKYIGSSKPTCKLCHYYFEEHKFGVECRTTHGNIYTAWRFPDVPNSLGDQGNSARKIMLDRVLQRVRKDAFDLVKRKVEPTYRHHDSLTSSARLTLDERWRLEQTVATDEADDVVSLMGSLNMEDRGGALLAV